MWIWEGFSTFWQLLKILGDHLTQELPQERGEGEEPKMYWREQW